MRKAPPRPFPPVPATLHLEYWSDYERSHRTYSRLVCSPTRVSIAGRHRHRPWHIGIRDPRGGPGELMAGLAVTDRAVVSSGDYERFRIADGRRYHHILDLRTGKPARKSRHVTVIASTAEAADGLATAVFILGPKAGLELVDRTSDTEALVVAADGEVYLTAGFQRWLKWPGELIRPR